MVWVMIYLICPTCLDDLNHDLSDLSDVFRLSKSWSICRTWRLLSFSSISSWCVSHSYRRNWLEIEWRTSWFSTSVQAHNPNFYQPRMNADRNICSSVTYLVSYRPPCTTEEGDIATFYLEAIGRALAAKMCPGQPRTFKMPSSITLRRFGSNFLSFIVLFSERAGSRYSKASL